MKELRCFVFTDLEVVNAVLTRRRRRREPMPEGQPVGVAFSTGENVTMTVRNLDSADHETVVAYEEEEVTAALVAFCMSRKIPLPVEADKSLYFINGNLTLMITMNFNKPPRMITESGEARASRQTERAHRVAV